MENWLSIAAGVYLLGMILYGHRRGFIRLAISMVAVILSLTIARVSLPVVTGFLKENTALQHTISESIKKSIHLDEEEVPADEALETPSAQRLLIEGLELPKNMKEALIENNNSEMYQALGVNAFTDYIGGYLADVILSSLGSVILFSLVYMVIKLLIGWLDIISKLPILSGINQIAGALLGGLEGLVFLWLACLVITAFPSTGWGLALLNQIEASKWLSFLYDHNLLNLMVLGLLQKLV
ncbi:MAG: CvpA family protein [Lacrimispora sp.]|uniref:CvpA family protein n=1 Tax=Lacrimispora sp. TaxID=2719234 RepID=UPI0039E499E9